MTRTILAGLAVAVSAVALLGTGCQSTGVGDPCTPEQEYDPQFSGFDLHEVSTESESFQCQTRLCLVNHFQGRVTCPYGQDINGDAIAPATGACFTPSNLAVTGPLTSGGAPVDPKTGKTVAAQCKDRTANNAVYCSCRCADINGTQNGSGTFCNCPDGFSCTQLVSALSAGGDQGLTGAYCIRSGTALTTSSCAQTCGGGTTGDGMTDCGGAQNNGQP